MDFQTMAVAAVMVAAVPAMMTTSAMATQVAISISIPVTGETGVNSTSAAYDCAGRAVTATYVNAGEVSLAVLDIDGETVVASNVLAASGARYAGGRYVWWTKGDEADLYDLMDGGDDKPVAHCLAR